MGVIEVNKFFPLGENARIDLSRVVGYYYYTWIAGEPTQHGYAYRDSYDPHEIGNGICALLVGNDGLIRRKDLVATIAERERFDFIKELTAMLDKIFLEADQVSFFLPYAHKQIATLEGKPFIRVGDIRIRHDAMAAYYFDTIPIGTEEFVSLSQSLLPEDLQYIIPDPANSVLVVDYEPAISPDSSEEELKDYSKVMETGVAPVILVELANLDENLEPVLLPAILFTSEEQGKQIWETLDYAFARNKALEKIAEEESEEEPKESEETEKEES